MTKIKILCVGKIKEKHYTDGISYYANLIRNKYPLTIVECADEPTPDKASAAVENQIRKVEGERLLSRIRDEDHVIALCIDGKQHSSGTWGKHLRTKMKGLSGNLVFVIGGSLGLSDEVIRRANEKISFSAMTFPHQMMRMILCEQLAGIL